MNRPQNVETARLQLQTDMQAMDVAQWKYLVSRIHKPTMAKIIVEYLDNDPAQKARFAGIYIRARDTVQRSRVRYAKARQWAEKLARVAAWISQSDKHATATQERSDSRHEPASGQPLVWPVLNPL